jgi:hypothetical protein
MCFLSLLGGAGHRSHRRSIEPSRRAGLRVRAISGPARKPSERAADDQAHAEQLSHAQPAEGDEPELRVGLAGELD